MSYGSQAENMRIGTKYILSPELIMDNVGGGYNTFAKELQDHSHTLLSREPSFGTGHYLLIFEKEYPSEFEYPAPLRIATNYIYQKGIKELFIPDEEMAAKKIQNLVRRKQVKQRTLEELYAPGGLGAQAAYKNFQEHMGATRRRKRKNKKSRKSRK